MYKFQQNFIVVGFKTQKAFKNDFKNDFHTTLVAYYLVNALVSTKLYYCRFQKVFKNDFHTTLVS